MPLSSWVFGFGLFISVFTLHPIHLLHKSPGLTLHTRISVSGVGASKGFGIDILERQRARSIMEISQDKKGSMERVPRHPDICKKGFRYT